MGVFGYGHGVLSITVNKEALGAGVGAGAGIVQTVALQGMDATHTLPIVTLPLLGATGVGDLTNIVTGGIATGISVAGMFGKGPVKNHPTLMAGGLAYGAVNLLGSLTAHVFNLPAVRVTKLVTAAKAALAKPVGGFKSASAANVMISAPWDNQSAVVDTFA